MSEASVVIIGGGLAGLTIAKTLEEKSFTDYLILEAQNQLGGRIRTESFKNGALDLGAQWLHGVFGNSLYRFAQKHGILGNGEEPVADENGPISKPLVKEVWYLVMHSLELCTEVALKQENPPSSVGEYLRNVFKEYLLKCIDDKEVLVTKEAVFNWICKFLTVDNACETLDDLCPIAWGDYVVCGGASHTRIHQGFSKIIETFLHYIPDNKIMLNAVVEQLLWDSHENAIEMTGFGTVDKVFLEFSEPFWEPGCTGYQLVWTQKEITQPSNVLIGWLWGKGACQMELLSEREVGHQLANLLRIFLRNPNIPDPIHVMRSQWYSNEYIRGSYSYRPVNVDSNACEDLTQVIFGKGPNGQQVPRILFAGEGCHRTYYSTAHGAFMSGIEQAEKFIKEISIAM